MVSKNKPEGPGAPRNSRLKVFRTAIGFHDAYVAAPSQKAALEAWGASRNLFAIGAAELVEDPELTAEPLAFPGKVLKRSRGSLSEQVAALERTPAPNAKRRSAKQAKAAGTKSKPKPRPSREEADEAEAALERFRTEAQAEMAELRAREAAIRREREALEKRQDAAEAKLAACAAKAQERYKRALERWRAE